MIHLHNGDVVAAVAQRSGIPGEHLSFRESLVTGLVRPGPEWTETRAQALAAAFHQDPLRTRTSLLEQEQALDRATDEVVLWFEHDLFCLANFLYLLQRVPSARLTCVWHPTPLGELDEGALYLLYESRAAVTPRMLSAGREAWRAYTSPDPLALNAWLERDTPDFPFLREGLTLHASRFPSVRDGLGLIEQRLLTAIVEGATDFATLFPQVDLNPPRFGFGDSDILRHLRALAGRPVPLITMKEVPGQPPKALFQITPAGENVLGAEVDDLAINDPDLFLGGAHITKGSIWRWDGRALRASR
jgi:hypothetical protein